MVIQSQLIDFLKALKGVLESAAEPKEVTSHTELSHPLLGMNSQRCFVALRELAQSLLDLVQEHLKNFSIHMIGIVFFHRHALEGKASLFLVLVLGF